jgi:putative ATPase
LLFIDEIHRFNRAQQDALLPDVEEGIITLVGATTSNPSFTVNSALVSRSQIFQFQPLDVPQIELLLDRALADSERGLGAYDVELQADARQHLARVCDGDARRALNTLEIGVLSSQSSPLVFDLTLAIESVQRKAIHYDASGDEHYDTISALIKSIRGSDPDAGIYWLASMLEAGEDIRFLCRRLVILASEDIGNADPQALTIAVAGMQACEMVGLPECQLTLAQVVTYLACAPKSNAATTAIGQARRDISEGRTLPVPTHLRDSHYGGARQLGHGEGYVYAHNEDDGIASQDYLGVEREYYQPVPRGFEAELIERLALIRQRLKAAREPEQENG